MAGFMDILGSMLQQGMSTSSGSRMTRGLGAGSSAGSLNDIMRGLNAMLGGGQPGQAPQTREMGGGLGEILGSLANNKAAVGGLAALAGALLGGKGGAARGAVGGGGLAMLASLALSALQKAGQAPRSAPRALMEAQTVEEQQALEREAEIIVKAMINAAKADGQIDEAEIQQILGKLAADGLTEEEKTFFLQEARQPMDIEQVVASAGGDPQIAAQIYAASLLAIEVDTSAEQQYLQRLAAGMGLGPQVTAHIEQTLGM